MGATLDALYKLQQIDQKLRATREKIDSKNRQVRAAERRVNQLERQIEDAHLRYKTAQSEADKLDLERQTHEQHIARLREALNRAKTNKEYAAILTELNTDKADATRLDEQAMAALTRAEEIHEEEVQLETELDKARRRVEEHRGAVEQVSTKLAEKINKLESQREEAADALSPDVREVFDRAAEQNDGDAMAAVEQTHPKRAEYVCSGCYMSVTLETINALQSTDRIQQCQTCLRILYLEAPAGAIAQ